MKKGLLIMALAGAFAVPTATHSMIAPGTQALGAGALITAGIGATGYAIGRYGVANIIGTPFAGVIGTAAGLITNLAVDSLIALECCPALLATNPLVAPILVGSCVACIMFHKRRYFFPGRLPELEKFSAGLLALGAGLGIVTLTFGAANICGYDGISLHSTNAQ